MYECTNAEFAAFVEATGFVTESERFGWSFVFHLELTEAQLKGIDQAVDGVEWWLPVPGSFWREPTGPGSDVFENARGTHPVVQVSWNDAAACCARATQGCFNGTSTRACSEPSYPKKCTRRARP